MRHIDGQTDSEQRRQDTSSGNRAKVFEHTPQIQQTSASNELGGRDRVILAKPRHRQWIEQGR